MTCLLSLGDIVGSLIQSYKIILVQQNAKKDDLSNCLFFQYCKSTIGFSSIAPYKFITLNLFFLLIFGIAVAIVVKFSCC